MFLRKYKIVMALFAAGLVIIALSCAKEKAAPCTGYSLQEDRHIIDSFITAADTIGFIKWNEQAGYYEGKVDADTGSTPTKDSLVGFTEALLLLNGTLVNARQMSATQPLSYYTSTLLAKALSKLRNGGLYDMILPSSSAYALGCTASAVNGLTVPANSQLIYSVKLTAVTKPATK